MFELAQLNEVRAAASAATGGSSGFDPQQIGLLIGGIVGGIIVSIGTFLYRKAPTKDEPEHPSISEARVFFQGPFQAIIDRLNSLLPILERIVSQNADIKENIAEAMKGTRHDLKGVLQHMSQDAEQDAEEIKRLLHDLVGVLGRLDEFLRARVK